jgi:NAD-dependent SIR2 family protein deacetylase
VPLRIDLLESRVQRKLQARFGEGPSEKRSGKLDWLAGGLLYHERAGSKNVTHLHGEIMFVRPEDDDETLIPWLEDLNLGDLHEEAQLRPHVVWFGEGVPLIHSALEAATATDVDVLIVVGSTLEVSPANLCAFQTKAPRVFLVDPEPPEFMVANENFVPYFPIEMQSKPHKSCTPIAEAATTGVRKVVDLLLAETTVDSEG